MPGWLVHTHNSQHTVIQVRFTIQVNSQTKSKIDCI